MPADVTQASNFLLHSDYPLDKIVYLTSGSLLVGAGSSAYVDVAHGLGYAPLAMANWSTASDFSVTYEENTGPLASTNAFGYAFKYNCSVRSDSTNLRFTGTNFLGASSVTLYYRIYCFAPSDINTDISHTESSSPDFILNTDYNYTKLIDSGIETFSSTFGTSASTTISHGLGYKPQVIYWIERSGMIDRVSQSYELSGITAKIGNSNLTLKSADSLAADVHWRLYADE